MKTIRPVAIAIQFTLAVVCPSAAFAGPITYYIEPSTFAVDWPLSGSITTNGTQGPLSATDIVDYEIHLHLTPDWPWGDEFAGPFVFRPDNTNAALVVGGPLIATESTILLPDGPPWASG